MNNKRIRSKIHFTRMYKLIKFLFTSCHTYFLKGRSVGSISLSILHQFCAANTKYGVPIPKSNFLFHKQIEMFLAASTIALFFLTKQGNQGWKIYFLNILFCLKLISLFCLLVLKAANEQINQKSRKCFAFFKTNKLTLIHDLE